MSDNPYLARAREIVKQWDDECSTTHVDEIIAAAMAEAASVMDAELAEENVCLRQRIEAAEDCVQNYGMDRDGLLRILRGEEPS